MIPAKVLVGRQGPAAAQCLQVNCTLPSYPIYACFPSKEDRSSFRAAVNVASHGSRVAGKYDVWVKANLVKVVRRNNSQQGVSPLPAPIRHDPMCGLALQVVQGNSLRDHVPVCRRVLHTCGRGH
jgi:hypothetical protein